MARRKRRPEKQNLQHIAFTRFMLVIAFFVLWMGGITARLLHLQIQQHAALNAQAERQRLEVKRDRMLRGTIYDRDGRILAMSRTVKTLYADPHELSDLRAVAKKLAKTLGLNETKLHRQLSSAKSAERRYVPIVKELDDDAVQRINRDLEESHVSKPDQPKFPGLHWREEQKRSYPQQTTAAHVIGFSNDEGVGQAGIEQSLNDVLFGPPVKRIQERDRFGRIYDERVSEQETPSDVILTISVPIQFATEQALERAVHATGARGAMAVVLNNKTGEILAMANYPTFDANKLREFNAEAVKNAAIQNIYAPGSVFKLITYGAALEKKLISPEAEIDSGNGTIEIAKHKFRDSHPIGRVSYAKALAHSSNVCAIKTGMRVGRDDFYGLVQRMGFGKPTRIELPAETGGIVRAPGSWNGDSLASMSIGYEIGVTALQMATAFSTIANDGVRVRPHIIKEIRGKDGNITSTGSGEKTTIVTSETAGQLRLMLREVVLSGTGKRAQLNQHTSAGKTGTAWKFDPKLKRINSAQYVSSFIGFAPVDEPAITIAVVIDEPRLGGRGGGHAAAPVFREIAESVLAELRVPPDKVPGFESGNHFAEDVTDGPLDSPPPTQLPPRPVGANEKHSKKNRTEGAAKFFKREKVPATGPTRVATGCSFSCIETRYGTNYCDVIT